MNKSFSLYSLMLIPAFVAVFVTGWLMPSPRGDGRGLTPVILTARDISAGTLVKPEHFRTVHLGKQDVSDLAVRDFSHIEGAVTKTRIRRDNFVFADELWDSSRVKVSHHVPPDKKVEAISLSDHVDPMAWHLLSESDIVSIFAFEAGSRDDAMRCLVTSCCVFRKLDSAGTMAVCVWLSDSDARAIRNARRLGLELTIDKPKEKWDANGTKRGQRDKTGTGTGPIKRD